jgi:mitosis inhibitor protein kinase SWE1
MAFSNSTGETLTLPSPTHPRHVDVTKTVRSLRRSLSRSPSRFNLLRPASDASDRATAQSQSPTPTSATERQPNNQTHDEPSSSTSPIPLSLHSTNVTTPLRPNIKLSVRSIKSRPTPARSTQRSRISPKSPLKRILGDSPDSTEPATHYSVTFAGRDQENTDYTALASPSTADSRRLLDKSLRHSLHLDGSDGLRLLSPKLFEGRNEALQALVSPLKRSDALMDLEQSTSASPKAKRRSLHGLGSLGGDLSIFDQGFASQQCFNIHEDNNSLAREVAHVPGPDAAGTIAEASEATATTAAPRKPFSLRKKTLQQRTAERRGHDQTFAQALDSVASPIAKSRPRLSLDQYLPPGPRESPFQSPGDLLNPSVHMFERPLHHPHPLSRSLTQSSSSSSVMEDSPSHIPLPVVERPRGPVNFSKSLPPGSSRPTQGFSEAIATPRYKSALPNQAAFMSTGFVSKKNWHLQLDAAAPSNAPTVMPDTPCKKQVYSSNTYPPQSGSGRRRSRPSFGSPSTPFNPLLGGSFGTFGLAEKGSSLFKLPRSKHSRKASVFSVDGDDPAELLSLFDNEIPPTPTKNSIGKPATPAAQIHSSPIVQQVGITRSVGPQRDGLLAYPNCE